MSQIVLLLYSAVLNIGGGGQYLTKALTSCSVAHAVLLHYNGELCLKNGTLPPENTITMPHCTFLTLTTDCKVQDLTFGIISHQQIFKIVRMQKKIMRAWK